MPDVIGQYRITGVLGEGGMGKVYAAEHTLLGRTAAVKVLLPDLSSKQEVVQRFFNEARAATAIRHPGIVEIYDFGWTNDGAAFIVMEHLQGETLRARRKRGPMPLFLALGVTRQIAGALAAAHAKGIVHRDLKPDNVFLVPDPEVPGGERIKLLDFGIAKLASSATGQQHSMTRTGALIGTPTYMAPEQCRGVAVDSRADLYALGCILFELICGRPPFVGEGEGDVLAAHIYVPPPKLAEHSRGVPKEVEAIVQRLLAKSPTDRAQTAEEVIRLIDGAGSTLSGSRAVTVSPVVAGALPGAPMAHATSQVGGTVYSDTTLSSAITTSHRIPRQGAAPRRRLVLFGIAGASVALAATAAAIIVGSSGDKVPASNKQLVSAVSDSAPAPAEVTSPPTTTPPAATPPTPTPTPSSTPAAPATVPDTPAGAPSSPTPAPTPTPTPTTPEAPAPPPSPTTTTPAAPAKNAKPASKPEAPKPAIETVYITITSAPPGADILRDKVVIGQTPSRVALPRTNRDVKLVLRLSKYQTSTLVVHADGSTKPQHVKLLPVAHNQAVNPFDDDN